MDGIVGDTKHHVVLRKKTTKILQELAFRALPKNLKTIPFSDLFAETVGETGKIITGLPSILEGSHILFLKFRAISTHFKQR
jgi:hypothetical protein